MVIDLVRCVDIIVRCRHPFQKIQTFNRLLLLVSPWLRLLAWFRPCLNTQWHANEAHGVPVSYKPFEKISWYTSESAFLRLPVQSSF
jgi:hypothetical protein